jgi:glucose-1-phosphate cytidylyltransferase
MKVVILCGGQGTRLREETEYKPKPMVEIGQHPILWHIMKIYSAYGFNEFILCLGYKGEVIKDYFYHFKTRNSDFTIELNRGKINIHESKGNSENDWQVTLADTGVKAMTGARIKRVQKYISDDTFMLTYGDGLADINIKDLLKFHNSHGKIGTLSGVPPPSRFGELTVLKDEVTSFREKPKELGGTINGGFFVFNKGFFDYLSADDGCYLEREPLAKLADNNQLNVYRHGGFWQCMDTYRDYTYLTDLWKSGKPPWKVW